jgi:MFS family permease
MMVDLNTPGQPAGWLVRTACGYDCSTKQHRPRALPLRTEPWFIFYGLLGLTQNGLVPVLMPLAAPHGGAAGLTYAAFSLLGVFAPFLGSWADRTGRHRDLLVWGTMSSGALLLPFEFVTEPLRIILAAGAGLGAMATATAGNVLAIQGQPEPLWDARVAILQRYMSGGQVIGLITAGLCWRFWQPERRLLPLPRMALPVARLRNPRRGRWSAATPGSPDRTTGVTTCPGRSFAPVSE